MALDDAPHALVGIMSGTSLDGADAVLVQFHHQALKVCGHAHRPYAADLREHLLGLQTPRADELALAARTANQLADHYAELVATLLQQSACSPSDVVALAVHGQTIRHRPDEGYTLQLNAPARLVELTGIDVVCDFRSRDVAAGGQGAPLVPAFHAAMFAAGNQHRAALNLGGMANLTDLPPGIDRNDAELRGWDTGPGNVLLDAWFSQHAPPGAPAFDQDGALARAGRVDAALLAGLLDDPWFKMAPPKSTGRDHFNLQWLARRLATRLSDGSTLQAADVQATLAQCTAESIARDVQRHIPALEHLIVCGGGVYNNDLMQRIAGAVVRHMGREIQVSSSTALGILPEQVEAIAFAWLGERFLRREPGNRATVTGARGPRILGALYPAGADR